MTTGWECMLEYTGRTGLQPCEGYVDCDRIVCLTKSTTKNVITETPQTGNGEENGEEDGMVSN